MSKIADVLNNYVELNDQDTSQETQNLIDWSWDEWSQYRKLFDTVAMIRHGRKANEITHEETHIIGGLMLKRLLNILDEIEGIANRKTDDNSCDECLASMINGVYCHEVGCPNRDKVKVDGQWLWPASLEDPEEWEEHNEDEEDEDE